MPKRILIIDDDPDLSTQMAEVLSDEGHTVECRLFTLGNISSLNTDDFDIIILDVKMPDISGIDILKIFKQEKPKSKIFIVSGRPFIEKILKEENLLTLVSDIIPKPFSIQNLLNKINNT